MFVKGQVKRKCNFVFHGQNIGNLSAEPSDTTIKAIFRPRNGRENSPLSPFLTSHVLNITLDNAKTIVQRTRIFKRH